MVSAEFAVAMPAVLLVLALACAVLGFVVDEIRCLDAARAGARAASRGDTSAAVRRIAEPLAPPGAAVTVTGGEVVRVVVHAPARRLGGWLPAGWDARAAAQLPRETPGVTGFSGPARVGKADAGTRASASTGESR